MSMNYEKKYRNLVEAIKELQEANPSDDGIQKWVKENVPELMESEDERIRKEIINYFRCQSIDEPSRKDIHNKWIAWLEKQGEHKPADKIEQEYHCTGVREPKEATGVLKQLLNKENYAWSEEDEAYRVDILVKLEPHITDDNFTDVQNWLKSLKDRVQSQPKQEWRDTDLISLGYLAYFVDNNGDKFYGKNKPDVVKWIYSFANRTAPQQERSEEDKVRINRIVAFLEKLNLEYLNVAGNDILLKDIEWLKSLKDRYTWKPSEEQMIALQTAIRIVGELTPTALLLKEIREQLKKLREE